MVRKLVFALAFMCVPAVAAAQDHSAHSAHHDAAKADGLAAHEDFAQQLIAKRAELKLTDAQIEKLRVLSAKMVEHHKSMGKNMEHDVEMEEKMHTELRAVFNKEQLKQVHALMAKHAAEACGGDGKGTECKVPTHE